MLPNSNPELLQEAWGEGGGQENNKTEIAFPDCPENRVGSKMSFMMLLLGGRKHISKTPRKSPKNPRKSRDNWIQSPDNSGAILCKSCSRVVTRLVYNSLFPVLA